MRTVSRCASLIALASRALLVLACPDDNRADSGGAPVAQTANGTYGRWRYAAHYNVFVLVNGAGDDVFFYKHTAGCGQ